jgi:hypothetical protein
MTERRIRSFAPSRAERGERRSRSQAQVTRTESEWDNTGVFGSFGAPKVTGVSDEVALATRRNVSAARRAERAWLRTLSAAERRSITK